MNTTTGIQSTGPQGLPASSVPTAKADEQSVAMFEQLMAAPESSSSVDGPQLMEEQIRLHHETASDKPNDPKQTGDRSLIDFDGKGGVVRDLP
jgi:hypothetical protein